MTREEIEKAAIENRYYYLNIAETKKIAEPKAVAFAIEIANAALEEAEDAAAIAMGKGLRATDVVLAIRALKVKD